MKRTCENCKFRYWTFWEGMMESCIDYAKVFNAEDAEKTANACPSYEYGTPSCMEEDDEYTPSSTAGDYGPSNPWNAPGMSISDFI